MSNPTVDAVFAALKASGWKPRQYPSVGRKRRRNLSIGTFEQGDLCMTFSIDVMLTDEEFAEQKAENRRVWLEGMERGMRNSGPRLGVDRPPASPTGLKRRPIK